MKLCPQCEFIYEDEQKFCDMDGQELVHDPKPHAFDQKPHAFDPPFAHKSGAVTENAAALLSLPQSDHAATPVTKIHIPLPTSPASTPSPVANADAGPPAKSSSGWQPRGLAIAALAGLALVALLFVVYYARTHQSQTRKANRSSSESAAQSDNQSRAQEATHSADAQSVTAVASESATRPGETAASDQPLEQSSDQSFHDAASIGQTPQPSTPGDDNAASRARQSSTLAAAGASSETNRSPVIIRLNNGASIKADEAWEKKEGVWYRQAGMVTFLKRSQVRSIERPATSRSQTAPKAKTSIAQNQPRVGKPANAKNDSKVTSFLKKTGRVLRKPFRL